MLTKYDIEQMEKKMSAMLRRYPIIACIGLTVTIALLGATFKPVLAYVLNAFSRAQYKVQFMGNFGTTAARETWKGLVNQLGEIGNMNWIGKMLVEVPILRIFVVLGTMFTAGLVCYFLSQLAEAAVDYYVPQKVLYGLKEVAKGLKIIAKALFFWFCVASVRTFYGVRKMFRKGRKAFRRWMREQKAKQYKGLFEAK